MTDITTTQNTASIDLNKAGAKVIIDRIMEIKESFYTTSKEKYERKAKIIEEAEDMTTEEKLLAMDKNYDRHSLEVWQGIIAFGGISLVVICVVSGNPTIIKGIRRLVA